MTWVNKTVLVLITSVVLVLGLTVHKVFTAQCQADLTMLLDTGIMILPQAHKVLTLEFTNQDDQTISAASLKGHWHLLSFGRTFCPNVYPTTLIQFRELQGKLPQGVRDDLQVVLVNADPNHGTPQQIKRYLGYFNIGFQGLTGTPENIQKLASAVSISYIPADTSRPNYIIDHSGNLVIIGPDGKQRGLIRAPLNNTKLEAQSPDAFKPQVR